MSGRLAVWMVAVLTLAVGLSLVAPGWVSLAVVTLALPVTVVIMIRARRRAEGQDTAAAVVSAATALTADRTSSASSQPDWAAALGAELASITVPRERRRFALGAALAILGAPHRARSSLLAGGMAVAVAAALLGYSRATVGQVSVGHGGLGTVSMLLPPVILFTGSFLAARSTRSLRLGVETGILAALTTLMAVAAVYGVEAARWFDLAPHVSILDGEYLDAGTSRAAILDAVHPVLLLVHLLFWLPWPVLGAIAGVQTRRRATPSVRSSS